MAILAAYDIAGLGLWRSMRVYTFGAPRPGNRAFARLYDNKVPDTWHIMNYRVSGKLQHSCLVLPSVATLHTCLLPLLLGLQVVIKAPAVAAPLQP